MKSVIVVGSNAKLVVQVMLAIHSRWGTSCVLVGDENCRPIARSALCKKHHEVTLSGVQDEQFVQTVNRLSADMEYPILVPADCDGGRIIGRMRSRLHLPSTPLMAVEQIDLFDDKWRFYQFCREHGFNAPDTIYLGRKQDIDFDNIEAQLGLPFVLKPINQAGSVGVNIIYDRAYFDREIAGNPDYMYGPLIAQRFIAGDDGGLSIFAMHGQVRAFAIQKYVRNGVDFISNPYLESVVHKFCDASGYHGLVNLDVRLEHGTGAVYFTEANPRVWASTFAAVWCGLNFVAESIENDTPRSTPRILLRGHFHDRRHPLVWPRSWPYLLLGAGARGRMSRAMTFDRYLLPLFLASLPSRTVKFVKRHVFARGPVTRPHT